MTLRTKTLLAVGVTLAGLLALLYLAADQILLAGFVRLETQGIIQNVRRVEDALTAELAALDSTTTDYSSWDDTYLFAAGNNPTYPETNMTAQTFANLSLNIVLIFDVSGEPLYNRAFDLAQGTFKPIPPALAPYLSPAGPLMRNNAQAESRTGLLLVGDQVLLFASRPILTSSYAGPTLGTLVFARYLDDDKLATLAQLTHLGLALVLKDDTAAPPDFATAEALLSEDNPIVVRPFSDDTVAGYTYLRDPDGRPIAMLRADTPRAIVAEGRQTVTFFVAALLAAGLVFGGLVWLLLERMVLARLEHLSRSVTMIGDQGDTAARVPVSGRDELSRVGLAINGMLAALNRALAATRASEEKFRKLAETSAAAIFIAQGSRLRYANSRAEALTATPQTDLLSLPLLTTAPATGGEAATTATPHEPQTTQFEVQVVSPQGGSRWLEVTAGPIEYDGAPATIATAYDITERKQAQVELLELNDQLTRLVGQLERRNNESSMLSQLTDLLQACPTAEESYSVIGQFLPRLLPELGCALYLYKASRDRLEGVAMAGAILSSPREQAFDPEGCWALRLGRPHVFADGTLTCSHLAEPPEGGYVCVPIVARGDTLGVLHVRYALNPPQASVEPWAERLRLVETVGERLALALANVNLREALRHQAVRDPLTGLFNRRYMQETLERELSRSTRSGREGAVLFLDLDHFKQFNDTHGHSAGDALLRELGSLFRARLRSEDIACRYGGEEFLLIMPETPLEAAVQRADLLRKEVAALHVKHFDQLLDAVTISVGIASFPQHGDGGELIIRAADEALYQAKQAGRNRICVARA